jgi:hypothetical protein
MATELRLLNRLFLSEQVHKRRLLLLRPRILPNLVVVLHFHQLHLHVPPLPLDPTRHRNSQFRLVRQRLLLHRDLPLVPVRAQPHLPLPMVKHQHRVVPGWCLVPQHQVNLQLKRRLEPEPRLEHLLLLLLLDRPNRLLLQALPLALSDQRQLQVQPLAHPLLQF